MNNSTVKSTETLRHLYAVLKEYGIEEAEREAEAIICHLLGISRTELYINDFHLNPPVLEQINSLIQRRVLHEPLQYITGRVNFCGLEFRVGPGVLIPRPETEMLAEEIMRIIRETFTGPASMLDIGTGSGCIAVTVAKGLPLTKVTGTDISEDAVRYASENALSNRVRNALFLTGDLFEPVKNRVFDIIVSNPPYIRTGELSGLQREITLYEPPVALDGGTDGMTCYRRILEDASRYLNPDGYLIFEAGIGQAQDIRTIARRNGFSHVRTVNDLSGIERVLVFNPGIV